MRRRLAAGLAGLIVGLILVGVLLLSAGRPPHPHRHRPSEPTATAPRPGRPGPTAPHPGRAAPRGTTYGASVNLLFETHAFTGAQVNAALRALRATGARSARCDALWDVSEPAPPVHGIRRYAWGYDEIVATALARAGLTWLPILDYAPAWAATSPGSLHSPPRVAADFAAYARAFAARFGAGGSFWRSHPDLPAHPVTTIEIWNEPDNAEFWPPRPDPAAYARLYASARAAIDAVDPRARVIIGGLTDAGGFLPALLAADPALRGRIDGVAIHPYGPPRVVLRRTRSARATLTTLGLARVPLYVTEFGWTTSPPGAVDYAPPARRARWLARTLAGLRALAPACRVAGAWLYTWASPQRDPGDPADWYGIDPIAGGDRLTRARDRSAVADFRGGLTAPAPDPALSGDSRRPAGRC